MQCLAYYGNVEALHSRPPVRPAAQTPSPASRKKNGAVVILTMPLQPHDLLFHFEHRPSAREPARFDATLIPAALFQKGDPLRSEYWLIVVGELLYQFTMGVDISLQAA